MRRHGGSESVGKGVVFNAVVGPMIEHDSIVAHQLFQSSVQHISSKGSERQVFMAKKLLIVCFGTLALNKKLQTSWEDLFVLWTGKPGRKKYEVSMCLQSKPATEDEHKSNLELSAEHPEQDWTKDINQSTLALEAVTSGRIYVDLDRTDNYAYAYSPKDRIDRAEAERMIAETMKLYGFESIRCKWKKPKFVIQSV